MTEIIAELENLQVSFSLIFAFNTGNSTLHKLDKVLSMLGNLYLIGNDNEKRINTKIRRPQNEIT